jgi:hypothetical protein
MLVTSSRGGIKRIALSVFSKVKVNSLVAIQLQEVGMCVADVSGACSRPDDRTDLVVRGSLPAMGLGLLLH